MRPYMQAAVTLIPLLAAVFAIFYCHDAQTQQWAQNTISGVVAYWLGRGGLGK